MPASATCATRTPPVPTWVLPHVFPPVGSTLHLLPLLGTNFSQTARLPLPTVPSTSTPTSTATCPYTTSHGPYYIPTFTLLVLHLHIIRWEQSIQLTNMLSMFQRPVYICSNFKLPQGVAMNPINTSEALSFMHPGQFHSIHIVSFHFFPQLSLCPQTLHLTTLQLSSQLSAHHSQSMFTRTALVAQRQQETGTAHCSASPSSLRTFGMLLWWKAGILLYCCLNPYLVRRHALKRFWVINC